jgi:hypothetical protein
MKLSVYLFPIMIVLLFGAVLADTLETTSYMPTMSMVTRTDRALPVRSVQLGFSRDDRLNPNDQYAAIVRPVHNTLIIGNPKLIFDFLGGVEGNFMEIGVYYRCNEGAAYPTVTLTRTLDGTKQVMMFGPNTGGAGLFVSMEPSKESFSYISKENYMTIGFDYVLNSTLSLKFESDQAFVCIVQAQAALWNTRSESRITVVTSTLTGRSTIYEKPLKDSLTGLMAMFCIVLLAFVFALVIERKPKLIPQPLEIKGPSKEDEH